MPVSFTTIFRVLVFAALTLHVFVMYCIGRVDGSEMGFAWPQTIRGCLLAAVLLLPLVWAVALPDLPRMLQSMRDRRRHSVNHCVRCNYDLTANPNGRCPECGNQITPPVDYRLGRKTIIAFTAMVAIAWFVGCASGEAWLQRDEHQFLIELYSQPNVTTRDRAWPNTYAQLQRYPEPVFSFGCP